jgi:anti-sigma B factor antagonist
MKVRIESLEVVSVVAIEGSVDGLTADTLMTALQEHLETGNSRIVADLSAVEYTSSAGLRVLLATVKAARSRGGDLRLACVTPAVLKVLALSGFTSILKFYDGLSEAVESYAAPSP